jgi:hypothetical protein
METLPLLADSAPTMILIRVDFPNHATIGMRGKGVVYETSEKEQAQV